MNLVVDLLENLIFLPKYQSDLRVVDECEFDLRLGGS